MSATQPGSTQPGTVYNGRYEIQRHVARGGMAEVYLARDLLLDRPVALKVLFPELSIDQSFVERFRREAQAAANLSHQNIVSIFDWGEQESTYFIVMEYVDGRPLSDILRREGRFTADRAAQICAQVASALANAHRHGVVHRDVKPGNILLDAQGQVKVTDFGIARAGDTTENLTQTGAVMGTATYFSPEQAQGLDVDARTDVYSLGVVLYELVTGRPPFSGETPLAIAYKHVQEPVVPPREVEPSVPIGLEAIILTAMDKDRENRFPGAEELRGDLLRFTKGQTPIAQKRRAAIAAGALSPAQRAAADKAAAVAAPVVDPPAPVDPDATAALPIAAPVPPPAAGPAEVAAPAAAATTALPPTAATTEPEEEHKSRTGLYAGVFVGLLVLLIVLLVLLARTVGLIGSTDVASKADVAVADVVGKALPEARALLEEQKLKVATVEGSDATRASGVVLAQDPAGGSRAGEGSTVTLTVNGATGGIPVPQVTNLREAEARQLLEAEGFVVVTRPQRNESVSPGFVIRQDPAAGQTAPRGSTISLDISTGRELAPVPDVAGKSQADAVTILSETGYRVRIANEASATVPSGTATRTNPPAGSTLSRGQTEVTLFISSGPTTTTAPRVEVPNVRGKPVEEAQQILIERGFVPSVVGSGPVVVGQNPAGGTATRGSTVVLTAGSPPASSTTSTSTTTTSTTSPPSSTTTTRVLP